MTKPPNATSPAGYLRTALAYETPIPQRLEAIAQVRRHLDEEEQYQAFQLRLRGTSWQEIANLWGLGSRQAAQQRFGAAVTIDKLRAATVTRPESETNHRP
jgi:hypothetical protein